VYLNDSDQYGKLGATRNDRHLGLVLPRGQWEEIRALHPDAEEKTYRMRIGEEGDTVIASSRLVHGAAYGAEKKRFAEMTPEERRRYHQELVAEISQAAEAEGRLVTDFESYPGLVEMTVRIPRFAARQKHYLYFDLPASLGEFLRLRADERENPLYFQRPREEKLRFEVETAGRYDLEHVPAPLELERIGGMALAAWIRTEAGGTGEPGTRLTVELGGLRDPGIVEPSRYAELLNAHRALTHPESRTILLREIRP
jgi:hypothetical protein